VFKIVLINITYQYFRSTILKNVKILILALMHADKYLSGNE